jgi:hypothetical protein
MTTKYEEKRAELDKQHEEKVRALEGEKAIWHALPEALAQLDPSIHMHKLWGHAGSINFRFCEYETLRKGADPTLETVRALAAAFPHMEPLSLYRDGCVSVREDRSIKAVDYEKEQITITPVAPFMVRLDRLSNRLEIEWTATIADRPMRISVHFREHGEVARKVGRSIVEYEYSGGRGDYRQIVGVRSNRMEVSPALAVIGNARAEQIRYSSGDYKRAGDILIYWNSCDGAHAKASLLDLINAIER